MDLEGLDLDERDGGTRIRLKVKAGARTDAVGGVHAGSLRVQVVAAPEHGKANRAVLALLASVLDVAPSSLELLSGHTSPAKVVWIPLGRDRVLQRLQSQS